MEHFLENTPFSKSRETVYETFAPAMNVILDMTKSISGDIACNCCVLPAEIWFCIFRFCYPSDLLNIMLVCKHWKSIGDSEGLWREMFNKEFSEMMATRRKFSSEEIVTIHNNNNDNNHDGGDDAEEPPATRLLLPKFQPGQKMQTESWKHYFFRTLTDKINTLEGRTAEQRIAATRGLEEKLKNYIYCFTAVLGIIASTLLLLLRVTGELTMRYWIPFLALAFCLMGIAKSIPVPDDKGLRLLHFLVWLSSFFAVLLFGASLDGDVSWKTTMLFCELLALWATFLLMAHHWEKFEPRQNQNRAPITNTLETMLFGFEVMTLLLSFYFYLGQLQQKLTNEKFDKEHSWMQVNSPVYLSCIIVFFIALVRLVNKLFSPSSSTPPDNRYGGIQSNAWSYFGAILFRPFLYSHASAFLLMRQLQFPQIMTFIPLFSLELLYLAYRTVDVGMAVSNWKRKFAKKKLRIYS